jgi:hypothetical protein
MPVILGWRLGAVCTAVLLAYSPCAASPPVGTDAGFRQLILSRITAYGRGDVAAYTNLIDADFVHVSDLGRRRTRAEIPAFVAAHGNNHATYQIVSMTWKIEGTLAIVDAEIREHLQDHDGGIMEADIFVWRGNKWLYRHHAETAIAQSPRPVVVSATVLAEYVGSYRSTTDITDVITTSGGKLFDQMLPEVGKTELIPVGPDAFALPDDPTLLVFIRNKGGIVVQSLWHLPSGQVVNAPRTAERAR